MACIRDHGLASQGHPPKCGDPCPGACGQNAQCRVKQHSPFCTCLAGYEGDPFTGCSEIRDELYKNRSSRKFNSWRLFPREYDFPKTFSHTENLGPNSIEKNPTEKPTEKPTENPTEIPYTKKKSKNG